MPKVKSRRTSTSPSFSEGIISHYEKQGSEEVYIDEELPFENYEKLAMDQIIRFGTFHRWLCVLKLKLLSETSEYQVLRLGNIKNDKIKCFN